MAIISVMENEFSEAQTAAECISLKYGISYDNAVCYLIANASISSEDTNDNFVASIEARQARGEDITSIQYLNELLRLPEAEDIIFTESSQLTHISGIEDLLF